MRVFCLGVLLLDVRFGLGAIKFTGSLRYSLWNDVVCHFGYMRLWGRMVVLKRVG